MAVVLKHLRFAKQRFNSAADPVAKVALMLLPIATLLAMSSADQRRNRDDRARAKAWGGVNGSFRRILGGPFF